MAGIAIVVHLAELALAVGGVGFGLMLMHMMAEVIGSGSFFVLAVGPCRCPGKLERQNRQQDYKENSFHDADHSMELIIQRINGA